MSVRWVSLIRLLPLAGPGLLTAAVALNLALGALPIVSLVGMSVLLQRVHSVASNWPTAFALAVGALLLQQLLTPFQAAVAEVVARRVDEHCLQRLMTTAFRQAPVAALETPAVLDKLGDLKAAFDRVQPNPGDAAAGVLALIARYTTLSGAVGVIALVIDPLIGLAVAVTALLIRFGQRGSLARFGTMWDGLAGYRRRIQYLRGIATGFEAAKEIRVLGLLGWIRGRAGAAAVDYMRIFWPARRRLLLRPFLGFTAAGLTGGGLALTYLAQGTATGELTLLQFALGIQAVLIPIRFGVFFPECDTQTQFGWLTYKALLDLEASTAASPMPGTLTAGPARELIRFEGVAFRYPNGAKVFEELELTLPAGRSTAIVGLNGAGKSTLVKLLARFYDPQAGRITIDATDLRELDQHSWHRQLAVIFQDFVRYELTGAENVALQRNPCHTCVAQATRRAGANAIGDFSKPFFSRYQEGRDLSGGQWQRVALARALFAAQSGASILVLDEPTAALDVRAEVDFFDSFLDTTRGLTTVVISHRFSTVRRADNIVVLEAGKVVEEGTHDALIELGGRYEHMFRLQSERFQ